MSPEARGRVVAAVAVDVFGADWRELTAPSRPGRRQRRTERLLPASRAAAVAIRRLTPLSYPAAADVMGCDHATVMRWEREGKAEADTLFVARLEMVMRIGAAAIRAMEAALDGDPDPGDPDDAEFAEVSVASIDGPRVLRMRL